MSVFRQDEGKSGQARVLQIEVGLGENLVEIVADEEGHAFIVDPAFEVDRLLREAEAHRMRIEAVLVTHTHPDHIDGVADVVRLTGARVYVGRGELRRIEEHLAHLQGKPVIVPLDGGERFGVGAIDVAALATPGHTAAGVSYGFDGCVCTGDTLFIGGCGRTNFPGGDARTLWASLQRLCTLPEDTRVYPGHDYGATPTSTLARERETNPYLRCANEAAFVALRTGPNPPKNTRGPRP